LVAVTTNFKLHEGEVVPQYLKLRKKSNAARNSSSIKSGTIPRRFASFVFIWTATV